jgi:23S rRNA (uracil1939-C5)-methyltransferase
LELIIEKLIYGGDGLAHLPANEGAPRERRSGLHGERERGQGKAVFVPFVLPGERVDVTLAENKPGFARARLNRVLEPATGRVEPRCPYFGQCGGCHYQHAEYAQQLQFKSEILRETLRRIAKLEFEDEIHVHPSQPWNYRNRTRMRVWAKPSTSGANSMSLPFDSLRSLRVGMTPAKSTAERDDRSSLGTNFAIGYNRFGSHALLPVKECPISSPLIQRALDVMWKLGEAGRVPGSVVEVEFFVNAEDTELLLEITVDAPKNPHILEPVAEFARELRKELLAVVGVVPFQPSGSTSEVRLDVPEELAPDFGSDLLIYRTANANYRVSAGSFFQANRFLVDETVGLVTEGRSGGFALDLYAGVGLFSLPLSQSFRQVAAVESAPFSFRDLQANEPSNVTGYRVSVRDFLVQVPPETRFDYVVVDPPRGGLGEKVALLAAGLKAPHFTYVSCDPATLARDLRVLMQAGYRIREMHMLDLFPQTFHIESVVVLAL